MGSFLKDHIRDVTSVFKEPAAVKSLSYGNDRTDWIKARQTRYMHHVTDEAKASKVFVCWSIPGNTETGVLIQPKYH